jgi:hypothetical protein
MTDTDAACYAEPALGQQWADREEEMPSAKHKTVQFIGSPGFADFLKSVAKDRPEDVEIISSREDKDSARLGMDFGLFWHIVVSIAEAYSVFHLVKDMTLYLYTSKDKEVIAKTAVREITISVPNDATRAQIEEDVTARLNELFSE